MPMMIDSPVPTNRRLLSPSFGAWFGPTLFVNAQCLGCAGSTLQGKGPKNLCSRPFVPERLVRCVECVEVWRQRGRLLRLGFFGLVKAKDGFSQFPDSGVDFLDRGV